MYLFEVQAVRYREIIQYLLVIINYTYIILLKIMQYKR